MNNLNKFIFAAMLFAGLASCSNENSFHTRGAALNATADKNQQVKSIDPTSNPSDIHSDDVNNPSVNSISDEPGKNPDNTPENTITATPVNSVSPNNSIEKVPVIFKLELSPAVVNLMVGGSQQFTATLIAGDESKQDVTTKATWSTSNSDSMGKSLVEFNLTTLGQATAINTGSGKVIASINGLTAEAQVTVIQAELTSIKIVQDKPTLNVGDKIKFTATGKFEDGTERDISSDVDWTSVFPDIASIENDGINTSPSGNNSKGTLLAKAPGSSTVTAKIGKISATVDVDVLPLRITALAISPENPSIGVGVSQQFKVEATYQDGSKKDVTSQAVWTIEAAQIAQLVNVITAPGLVRSLKGGVSEILVALDGQNAKTNLTVTSVNLVSIAISPLTASIEVGKNQAYIATGTYSDNSTHIITPDVIWESTANAIASISNASGNSGIATGVAPGNANISAKLTGITSNSSTLTVTLPPPPRYALTAAKSGTGSGTITATGIACGTDCNETFDSGTVVILTASASVGSVFSGWSGACTNASGTCTISMGAAKSVTAAFTLDSFALTVAKSGAGSGSVSGTTINCGTTCTNSFPYQTSVTLSAVAATGSTFAGWSGACTNTSGTCVVSINAAKSVTAQFTLQNFALTVTKSGVGTGLVASSVANGINCGATCSKNLPYQTVILLTPTPSTGSSFAGWTGACGNISGDCAVTLDAAKSVNAKFDVSTYALTVTKPGTGAGTISGSGINCGAICTKTFDYGTSITLTASAATADEYFSGWSGSCSGTSPTCTVSLTQAANVSANFVKYTNLPLKFVSLGDTAGNTNCLFITVNGGAEQAFGCNRGSSTNNVIILARTKPSCNTIRLRMTTNGATAWTTANASTIATYFKITKTAPGVVKLQTNDNLDNDFNDGNFVVDGQGQIAFMIEGSNLACD